ncbi:hypothetical protein HDU97_009877 [Phlyctochytrium planicorne]|nr:hypothetical protein HDU97_009877 [Phlyctochytrium planicorne]
MGSHFGSTFFQLPRDIQTPILVETDDLAAAIEIECKILGLPPFFPLDRNVFENLTIDDFPASAAIKTHFLPFDAVKFGPRILLYWIITFRRSLIENRLCDLSCHFASSGNLSALKMLQSNGFRLNDYWLLKHAAFGKHTAVISFLNDIDLGNGYGWHGLKDFLPREYDRHGDPAELIRFLLKNYGSKVYSNDLLIQASSNGHVEVVRLLLDFKPSTCIRSALEAAAGKECLEVVKLLCSVHKCNSGSKAVANALRSENFEIADVLLKHGEECFDLDLLVSAGNIDWVKLMKSRMFDTADGDTSKFIEFDAVYEDYWTDLANPVKANELVRAAWARDLKFAEATVSAASDDTLQSAAQIAALFGHIEILKLLLTKVDQIRSTEKVAHAIVDRNDAEMVDLIGQTASSELVEELFRKAAQCGNISLLKKLRERHSDFVPTQTLELAIRNNQISTVQYLMEECNIPYEDSIMVSLRATRTGFPYLLKYLYEKTGLVCSHPYLCEAIHLGNLETVKYAQSLGLEFDTYAVFSAVSSENPKVFEYVVLRTCEITIDIVLAAVTCEKCEYVLYLLSLRTFDRDATARLVEWAIKRGHLETLKLMRSLNLEFPHSSVLAATQHSNIAAFEFLREECGLEWRYNVNCYSDPFAVIKYFHSIAEDTLNDSLRVANDDLEAHEYMLPFLGGLSFETSQEMDPSWFPPLDVLRFLVENAGYGDGPGTMDRAAEMGNLEAVRYLHEHATGGCTADAMDEAAANGHLAVVKFLHENRTEGCSTRAVDCAVEGGHVHIVYFLLRHRSEGFTQKAEKFVENPYIKRMLAAYKSLSRG